MSKHYFYLGREDSMLREALEERIREEGDCASDTIKDLLLLALGISDPTPKTKLKGDDYANLVQQSVALPLDWWEEINLRAYQAGLKTAAYVREEWRKLLDKPLPPKIERAPRDRALTSAMLMEEQVEKYNEMRNLRSQPRERELTWGEKVLENPDQVFQVSDCFVPGCREHDCGFHRHAGKDLLLRAAKYMPKGDQ